MCVENIDSSRNAKLEEFQLKHTLSNACDKSGRHMTTDTMDDKLDFNLSVIHVST